MEGLTGVDDGRCTGAWLSSDTAFMSREYGSASPARNGSVTLHANTGQCCG